MDNTRERLIQLRDWLSSNRDINFDMKCYRQEDLSDNSTFIETGYISENSCGTVGCIMGWAPFVGGVFTPVRSDFKADPNKVLCFTKYSKRIFGFTPYNLVWEFIFSSTWSHVNNTIDGAISRLSYVIDNFYECFSIEDLDNDEINKLPLNTAIYRPSLFTEESPQGRFSDIRGAFNFLVLDADHKDLRLPIEIVIPIKTSLSDWLTKDTDQLISVIPCHSEDDIEC